MVQTRRLVVLLAVTLAIMMSAMPAAEAQWNSVSKYAHTLQVVSSPEAPVTPLRESAHVMFEARFDCQTFGPAPGTDGFLVENEVLLSHPIGEAHVTPDRYWVPFDRLTCLQAHTFVQQIQVVIRFSDTAPAFETVSLRLDSVPHTDQTIPKAEAVQLTVGFAGDIVPRVDDALVVADETGAAETDLVLKNRANGAVRVQAMAAEGSDPAVTIFQTSSFVIGSGLDEGSDDERAIPLAFEAPPATSHTQVYSVAVRVEGESADDPEVSVADIYVPLVVVVPGTDGASVQSEAVTEAPAPLLPVLGLLAALGVAALRRRS